MPCRGSARRRHWPIGIVRTYSTAGAPIVTKRTPRGTGTPIDVKLLMPCCAKLRIGLFDGGLARRPSAGRNPYGKLHRARIIADHHARECIHVMQRVVHLGERRERLRALRTSSRPLSW